MNNARYKAAAVTYNDRLYMVAGCSAATGNDCSVGTILNTIEYSSITATPGGTGPYSTPANYETAGRISFATVAYGGYVYIIGGTTSINGGASDMKNTLRYAPINPDGSLGTWTTSSTGFNSTMTGSGGFCATAGNCPGRVNMAAAAYNGYLYIAGGISNGTDSNSVWSDVQSVPLDPTTGAPGTWTTLYRDFIGNSTTTYNPVNGRAQMAMQIYNGKMYLIGGTHPNPNPAGTNYATIYSADLTSTGGVGSFSLSSVSLPGAVGRAGVRTFVMNQRLYIVGGGDGSAWANVSNDRADVHFIPINDNGTLDGATGWKDANAAVNGGSGSSFSTQNILNDYGVAFSNGYLYISGGRSGTTGNITANVLMAKINTNGSLGSWSPLNGLTTPRHQAGSFAVNGFLYALGGCSNKSSFLGTNCTNLASQLEDYQYAQIYNNGGGSDGTWANTTAIPSKVGGNLSVAANGYLYTIGGCDDFVTNLLIPLCSTLRNTVHYAKINTNGSIGAWTATTSMIDGNYIGEAVAYNNRIYVIGGCRQVNANPCSSYSDGVQFATICTGVNLPVSGCTGAGAVSAWQYTYNSTTSPTYTAGTGFNGGGRWYISATTSNDGYMYIAGGTAAAPASPIADASQVQYAKINSDGTLGSWTNTSIYSTPRSDPALVTNGNYIYVGGGTTASAIAADVQYAEITSSGSLGSWNRTTDLALPYGSGASGVLNGYFYIWGGSKEAGNNSADDLMANVQYAPIFASGKLGKWTVTPGFGDIGGAVGLVGFGGTIANGHLYVLGGFKFNTPDPDHITSTTSAHYAPVQSQPQIARYSILRSTDLPSNPANYFTNTTKQSQNSVIQIGFTAGTPAFGSVSTRSSHTNGTKYPLSINGDGASYYWLPIILDDSKSMTFGESSSSTSRINYFQLNYHPNAGMRLRGGKTFNNNVQQSLDAY